MNNFIDKFNSFPLGHKVLFLIGLMILIFVGFWMGIYNPLEEKIDSAEKSIATLQQEEARLEQLKQSQAQVLARLENLKRRLMIAREKLPEDAEIPSLLQRIHNHGQTAGLEINKFKQNPDIAQSHFIEIPVDMEFVGTFDQLADFFFSVGRMTRIVNVKDVTLTRRASGMSPEGDLVVSARATTFRLKTN